MRPESRSRLAQLVNRPIRRWHNQAPLLDPGESYIRMVKKVLDMKPVLCDLCQKPGGTLHRITPKKKGITARYCHKKCLHRIANRRQV